MKKQSGSVRDRKLKLHRETLAALAQPETLLAALGGVTTIPTNNCPTKGNTTCTRFC